ncbi:hypothetical protein [Candidatus Halobonum tyrrellensis]|uniref:DNA primase/polymerase bifunctional N-terminal domain-containing protein n=1 Tax=Candidatus Halobonum tyrrellensis G22 TaxID=1324957 RepID=V4HLX7_9EURY|nr:hypothetical protein [Candidatus Halobonum tyrrellensis]ESP88919.1 hypothetical protein K933_06533 [Candidatus Halobonum tyrrellensis G22]
MNTTSHDHQDIDWHSIRDHVVANIDDIRPATYDEMMDGVEAIHDSNEIPMGVLDLAVETGLLKRQGDGLDDSYTFNLPRANEEVEEKGSDTSELHITDDGRKYALAMVERDSWVLYEEGEKQVKAPWKTGNLYNAAWGGQLDADEQPETDFETARRWSEMAHSTGLPGVAECGEVHPGYLLQRELLPPGVNIILIDIDDCIDPETNELLPEARRIIDRANSYTEVSMSGTGVHIFVFGRLPEWFPSSRLVEPMHTDEQPAGEQPKVEIYQRRRIVITTGDHLAGTPDDVADGHDLIADLCDEYYEDDRTAEDVLKDLSSRDDKYDSESSSGDRSPYFDVDPASLLGSGYRKVGTRVQGPHPKHGSSGGSSFADGGRNFAVENDVWTCYRHGTGGNALHLVAVMEEYLNCGDAGSGCLDSLSDTEFAQLCLDARDNHGFSGKPPYQALLGVAKSQGLAADSADQFDYGLRDVLTTMYEGTDSGML